MIHLSFSLPEPRSPWLDTWDRAKQVNFGDISEMDLRYKYFGVRAEMIVNNVEVVSKSGFVTLVDLALSVAWAVKRLAVGQDAAFNFTEGAEIIRLRHEGNLITLSSSLKPWTVSVGREQLVEALGEFLRKAHTCLVSDVPELAGNAVIQRFSPE